MLTATYVGKRRHVVWDPRTVNFHVIGIPKQSIFMCSRLVWDSRTLNFHMLRLGLEPQNRGPSVDAMGGHRGGIGRHRGHRLNPSDTSQINRRLRISGSNIAVIRVASVLFYFEELDKISKTQKTYVSSLFAVPVFFFEYW